MVPATSEETKTAIDALLSLGSDLQLGPNTERTENEILQPIAPDNMLRVLDPSVTDTQSDDTEILGEEELNIPDTEDKNKETVQETTGTKNIPRKGQLIVHKFQLSRNRKPTRKFGCLACSSKFLNNKELNDHFRNSHPPFTCGDCKKLFSTPNAFEKHKYKHYEFMYECDKCNQGFHFESELSAHRRKHIVDQGLVCFHANCGKRFKHSSELNANLKTHTGKPIKCDYCTYTNKDIRNIRAHARTHTNIESFTCKKCGKTFKWGSQKKCHIHSGKCPGS